MKCIALQKLKTLRHPGIIKFVQAQVQPTELVIVTEPVVPLKSVLKGLHADDICLGIYGLLVRIVLMGANGRGLECSC